MINKEDVRKYLEDEIETFERAVKKYQNTLEVAEFLENDSDVRQNKNLLDTCKKVIDRDKKKLNKLDGYDGHLIKNIDDININTDEGKLLEAAILLLAPYTDKTFDEIINILYKIINNVNSEEN